MGQNFHKYTWTNLNSEYRALVSRGFARINREFDAPSEREQRITRKNQIRAKHAMAWL